MVARTRLRADTVLRNAVVVLLAAFAVFALPAEAKSDKITIRIDPVNRSGASGIAVLTADGDKTIVELTLNGLAGVHPNHIHVGTCSDPVPEPLYPLTNIVLNQSNAEGYSKTTVDVSLDELLSSPYLILVHKSKDDIGTYVACGDIVASSGNFPQTGVGPFGKPGDGMSAVLLAAAGALGVGGLLIRRWRTHRWGTQ